MVFTRKIIVDQLTSAPGHINMKEHLVAISRLVIELARNAPDQTKGSESSEYEHSFRENVFALQNEYNLSRFQMIQLLGSAIEDIGGTGARAGS